MAQPGRWNAARLSPMILTAAFAIVFCALLLGFSNIGTGSVIVLGIAILLVGLAGVVLLDMRSRRKAA
jgi:membrane-bound ClpP family serine protease